MVTEEILHRRNPPRDQRNKSRVCGDQFKTGRHRRRNGEGCNTSSSEFTRCSFLSTRNTGKRWQPDVVCKKNPSAITHPGFNYKVSSRWFEHAVLEKPKKYTLPYIEHCGRISNSIQYYWTCKPSSCVSTMVATVYKRLLDTMLRRFKKKAFKLSNLLLRCAAYYVFTKNDYFWNRLLAVLRFKRSARRRAKDMILFYEAKLDDNTRFVLRQVWLHQANWHKSRAERPRAQSKVEVFSESSHRTTVAVDDISNRMNARLECNILRRVARSATTFWMLPYRSLVEPDTLSLESEDWF